jgi:hypothetical protein
MKWSRTGVGVRPVADGAALVEALRGVDEKTAIGLGIVGDRRLPTIQVKPEPVRPGRQLTGRTVSAWTPAHKQA